MFFNLKLFKRLYIFFKYLFFFILQKVFYLSNSLFSNVQQCNYYVTNVKIKKKLILYFFCLVNFFEKLLVLLNFSKNSIFFDYFVGYFLQYSSFFKYKILLLNVICIPRILVKNKKNNFVVNILDKNKNLIKAISLGQMRERREHKSVLRNRYLIMFQMGSKMGNFLLDYYTIKKKKKKKLKNMKSLYLLLYKRYCFFYIFKDINIIFFRFYYQYLFSYDKLVLNFFFFFFKYNFKF